MNVLSFSGCFPWHRGKTQVAPEAASKEWSIRRDGPALSDPLKADVYQRVGDGIKAAIPNFELHVEDKHGVPVALLLRNKEGYEISSLSAGSNRTAPRAVSLPQGANPVKAVVCGQPGQGVAILAKPDNDQLGDLLVWNGGHEPVRSALPAGWRAAALHHVDGRPYALAFDGHSRQGFWTPGDLPGTWTQVSATDAVDRLSHVFAIQPQPPGERAGPSYRLGSDMWVCLNGRGEVCADGGKRGLLPIHDKTAFAQVMIAPDRTSLLGVGWDGKVYKVAITPCLRPSSDGPQALGRPPMVEVMPLELPKHLEGNVAALALYGDDLDLLDRQGVLHRGDLEQPGGGAWDRLPTPGGSLPPGEIRGFLADPLREGKRLALVAPADGGAPLMHELVVLRGPDGVSRSQWVQRPISLELRGSKMLGAPLVATRLFEKQGVPAIQTADGKIYHYGVDGCRLAPPDDKRLHERFVKDAGWQRGAVRSTGLTVVPGITTLGGSVGRKLRSVGGRVKAAAASVLHPKRAAQERKQLGKEVYAVMRPYARQVGQFSALVDDIADRHQSFPRNGSDWKSMDSGLAAGTRAALDELLGRMSIDVERMQAMTSKDRRPAGEKGDAAQVMHNQLVALREHVPPENRQQVDKLCKRLYMIHESGGIARPSDDLTRLSAGQPDLLASATEENLLLATQLLQAAHGDPAVAGQAIDKLRSDYFDSPVQQARDLGLPDLHSLQSAVKATVWLHQQLRNPKSSLHKMVLACAEEAKLTGATDQEKIVKYLTRLTLDTQTREISSISATKGRNYGTPVGLIDMADLTRTMGGYFSAGVQTERSAVLGVEDFSGPEGKRALGLMLLYARSHMLRAGAGIGYSPVPLFTRVGGGLSGSHVRIDGSKAVQVLVSEKNAARFMKRLVEEPDPVKLFQGSFGREFADVSGTNTAISLEGFAQGRLPIPIPSNKSGEGGFGVWRGGGDAKLGYGLSNTHWRISAPAEGYEADERYYREGANAGAGVSLGEVFVSALTPVDDTFGLQGAVPVQMPGVGFGVDINLAQRQKVVDQFLPAAAVTAQEWQPVLDGLRKELRGGGFANAAWLERVDGLNGKSGGEMARAVLTLCNDLKASPPRHVSPESSVAMEDGRRQLKRMAMWHLQFEAGVPMRLGSVREERRIELARRGLDQLRKEYPELRDWVNKKDFPSLTFLKQDLAITEEAEEDMHLLLCTSGGRHATPAELRKCGEGVENILLDPASYHFRRLQGLVRGNMSVSWNSLVPLVQDYGVEGMMAEHIPEGKRLTLQRGIGNESYVMPSMTRSSNLRWADLPVRPGSNGPRPEDGTSAPLPATEEKQGWGPWLYGLVPGRAQLSGTAFQVADRLTRMVPRPSSGSKVAPEPEPVEEANPFTAAFAQLV